MSAPPFAYYGGKTTLADRIVELLPPHSHYVEPFAGSLAVLLAKPRSDMETVNDLDQDLVTFWRILRDRPEDLARVMDLTPHSRVEHQASYDLDVADDLERARRVWVLLSQGRGSTLRRTGWRFYRDPAGSTYSMPDYLAAYADRVPACARRLHGVYPRRAHPHRRCPHRGPVGQPAHRPTPPPQRPRGGRLVSTSTRRPDPKRRDPRRRCAVCRLPMTPIRGETAGTHPACDPHEKPEKEPRR